MDGANSTIKQVCGGNTTGIFAVILLFMALPFHFLMIKILAINFRFSSPRHIILLCLSVSDCIQITVSAVCMTVLKITVTTTETATCKALSHVITFTAALTFVVSSLTLVALSVERYIGCFYSLHRHVLLTNKRFIIAVTIFWILGLLAGLISLISDGGARQSAVLTNTEFLGKIMVTTTLSVSSALVFIQVRLIILSMKNLKRVIPGASAPNPAEQRSFYKQLRIATVTSIVFVSYILCMVPSSFLIIMTEFTGIWKPTHRRQILVISLGMANTLLNPFIYGLGMLDTKQAIKTEINKIKTFVIEKICIRDDSM